MSAPSDRIAHLEANDFPERAKTALGDETLRGALDHVTDLFATKRQAAIDTQPEWEAMRTRAAALKEEVLANWAENIETFVRNAEARGVLVHRAQDRDEACRILADIAEEHGAQTVVKSKSMVTEEVGLNAVLEARGMTPVETDLGEYIIQLAGELPSHIIAPAIHKTRGQIGELFEKELGEDYTDDVEALAGIARRVLRQAFLDADLGVTGVNFAMVDTGSLLLLENEGNIRMSSSLPKVHIALMGIEKLLPRLADLPLFLRLLPRSATGQDLSVYQTLFTGVKSEGEEGPEEVHLVLLDNGRTALLEDPLTRQSLGCIRCGACLNACPVYKQVGGHAYGSVYPGPIGAILTPQLAGIGRAKALPYASSLCGACRDVCPVKIDIPALLLRLRAESVEAPETRGGRFFERLAFRGWSFAMGGPKRYGLAARAARALWPLRGLAGPARSWEAGRTLRRPDPRPFRARWKDLATTPEAPAPAPQPTPEAPAAPLGSQPPHPGRPAPPTDLRGAFARQNAALGVHVHHAADEAAARAILEELAGGEALATSDAAHVLRITEGLDTFDGSIDRARLATTRVGVTGVQAAIAETGTLMLSSRSERHRLVSLVPAIHVAIVRDEELVADLDEAYARAAAGGLPPALSFATGPSRTADIELKLVVGVHGPREVHVILLPGPS